MNGRIYDFNVGRFLSVDPLLQFPENSQSANPYSYILNNPMSGVDPTGYSAIRSGNASNWRVPMCDSNYGNTCAKTPVDNIMAQWGLSNGQGNESLAKQGQINRQQVREERESIGLQEVAETTSYNTGYDPDYLLSMGYMPDMRFFNDIGGDFRFRPGGVSVKEDQAARVIGAEIAIDGASMLLPMPSVAKVKAAEKVVELIGKSRLPVVTNGAGKNAKEGIYEFTDTAGKKYCGQSCNIPNRLDQHVKSGKLDPNQSVSTTEVLGGKTAREIAEHRRIQEITGGVPARFSDRVSNKVDPIGPNRGHLLDD